MLRSKNKRSAYISFEYVIMGAIVCIGLTLIIPMVKNHVKDVTDEAVSNLITYEKTGGSHILAVRPNDANAQEVNPWDPSYNPSNPTEGNSTTLTSKLYFDDAYPSVNTDDLIVLTVKSDPETVTFPSIKWTVLSGGENAVIMTSVDTKSIEVTGSKPGKVVVQAKSQDGTEKVTYAYITVIRPASDISVDKNSVEISPNGYNGLPTSEQITAIVSPADVSDGHVEWGFVNSNGSECVDISTNNNVLTVTAKKPAGISCNKTVTLYAQASNGLRKEISISVFDSGS